MFLLSLILDADGEMQEVLGWLEQMSWAKPLFTKGVSRYCVYAAS